MMPENLLEEARLRQARGADAMDAKQEGESRASHGPSTTGGCQCGAVRYAFDGAPAKIGLCHCRMCQRALGAPFGVFVVVATENFRWTKGVPASFASSNRAFRDFCGTCGTPLAFRPLDLPVMELMSGSLDEPEAMPPRYEVGREAKLAWIGSLAALPGRTTAENMGAERAAAVVSHQHRIV
jgi:hypothetical protein